MMTAPTTLTVMTSC